MTAFAALAGALFAGGLWLAVTSWPVPIGATSPPAGVGAWWRALDRGRVATAGGCALLGLLVTRWPVGAVGAAAAGWVLAGWRQRATRRREGRTEAIALWTELLRDALGTSRGIEGVLVATAPAAPVAIRPELQTMAERLGREPLDVVLDGLAADLDDELGDLVVTSLRLTAATGGRRVRDVLADLAAAAYAQADAQRRVAIARERPRSAMRYTGLVIGGFVALLLVFSRSYLAPYGSAGGQVVLALVGGYWAGGLWWMARMSRTPPPARVLFAPAVKQ